MYTNTITTEEVMKLVKDKLEFYRLCERIYTLTREFVCNHEGQGINKRIQTWVQKKFEQDENIVISYVMEHGHYKISFYRIFSTTNQNPFMAHENSPSIYLGNCYSFSDPRDGCYSISRLDKDNYWLHHIQDNIKKLELIDEQEAIKLVSAHSYMQFLLKEYRKYLDGFTLQYESLFKLP